MEFEKNMIFIINQNLYDMNIFGDILGHDNVVVHVAKCNYPQNIIMHIIAKIGRYVSKKFGYMFYDIKDLKIKDSENNYFIIDSGALRIYDLSYFKQMAEASNNVHLLLLLFNSMSASSPNIVAVKDDILKFDWEKVFTYDKCDAEKYGWEYFGLTYFSTPHKVIKPADNSDAYFVGGLKGNRDGLIIEVFEKLNAAHVKCEFDIYCYSKEQFRKRRYANEINYYQQWRKYDEIQAKVFSTNCIIEILQEGQNTQSVRYFEAVYYNKKLLTNNRNVVNMPYYNKDYMKYFETAEDIDVDWVMEKDSINYNYCGEFSTTHLLQQIIETAEKKGGGVRLYLILKTLRLTEINDWIEKGKKIC